MFDHTRRPATAVRIRITRLGGLGLLLPCPDVLIDESDLPCLRHVGRDHGRTGRIVAGGQAEERVGPGLCRALGCAQRLPFSPAGQADDHRAGLLCALRRRVARAVVGDEDLGVRELFAENPDRFGHGFLLVARRDEDRQRLRHLETVGTGGTYPSSPSRP